MRKSINTRNVSRFALFLFLISASLNIKAENARSLTNSTIKDVKVFLSGAQVNRNIKVAVEAGESILTIEGLSSQIDQGSINVKGTGNAMIMGVSFRMDYLKDTYKSPELKQLQDSLDLLKASLDKTTLMESVYNDELGFLNANRNTGGTTTGVNTENMKKVLDYYHSKMIDLRTKLLDLSEQKKKLNERIARINQQINDLNGKLNKPTGTILVKINAQKATNLDLDFSYYVQGAGWSPLYEIRSENISGPVKLNYKASVYQNTGEEWKNIRLSLSSANPVLGGNKPDLSPWYLNFYQPRPRPMYNLQGAPELQLSEVVVMDKRDKVSSIAEEVTVNQNQLETEFEIPLAYTIADDGKPVDVEIQSNDLQGAYAFYATPKLDRDAFLMTSITGWENLNLLAGKANIYFENSYVGESYIDPQMTEDTLKLSLGRDKRIIIKRELLKGMTSTKFIGSSIEKQFVYEITVKNTKKDAVELNLDDQLPVSQNDDIKVTVDELSGGRMNNETGAVNWKLNVKAGETVKIKLGFTVKYPKGKTIGNL